MEYTINEYVQLYFSNPYATRVEVYPNNQMAAILLKQHKDKGESVVSVSDCLSDGTVTLPMPDTLLALLDEKIIEQNNRTVVVGIDAYLSLLSQVNVAAFFVALRGRVDNGKLNAVYMVSRETDFRFEAPRYEEALDVIKIHGVTEETEPIKVVVVPQRWVKFDNFLDFKALMKQIGDFFPTGEYILALNNIKAEQAGLAKNLTFMLDINRVAEYFHGIPADLNATTLQMLLENSNKKNESPEIYLESEFGKDYMDVRYALARLLMLPSDELWPAYIWLLKKKLPINSYLGNVLDTNPTRNDLMRKYVVDSAVLLSDGLDVKRYAEERADAIKQLSSNPESLIVEFIGQTKNSISAVEFLNCGTNAEMREIVRRASSNYLATGLPDSLGRHCPILSDYLSECDYGDKELTAYFKEYRRLKVHNTVNENFVKKAYDLVLPSPFSYRDAILLELSTDSDMALLVVDGMGAEYYPLLLAMTQRYSMNVDSCSVVSVKLPTSTEYNPIKWVAERTLDEIKDIDNIAHNGAAKHENCPPERNIAAVLRSFESEILPRISEGLTKFSRVVLTSDHGSSRLAVLAHNNSLGTTLPWNGTPLDWRYSVAPQGENRPPELEAKYSEVDSKTYWVVRGYNRLPKQGGKLNELHGGASLEERLVPIIVFSRGKSTKELNQLGKKTMDQVKDKMGFDI